jgi:hypothetical protein
VSVFDDLVDDAVFLAMESQARTQELWGTLDWTADLAVPTFQFQSAPPTVFIAHLLGSEAPGPNTWLWGWANQMVSERSIGLVKRIRDYGAAQGIAELIRPEIRLTEDLPLRLTLAVEALTGLSTYFSGSTGGGSRMWVLLEGPQLELPASTVIATVGAITRGIAATTVYDHRRALRSYASRRSIPEVDGVLTLDDGTVTVEFDWQGRIASVSGSTAGQSGS